jgi:hypothetical protein
LAGSGTQFRAMLPRCLELTVAFGVDRGLPAVQHVPGRHVADGRMETLTIVSVHETFHRPESVFERQRSLSSLSTRYTVAALHAATSASIIMYVRRR